MNASLSQQGSCQHRVAGVVPRRLAATTEVSGGDEGARHGPSSCPAGPKMPARVSDLVFGAVAVKVNGEPSPGGNWIGWALRDTTASNTVSSIRSSAFRRARSLPALSLSFVLVISNAEAVRGVTVIEL